MADELPTLFRAGLLNPMSPEKWEYYSDGGLLVTNGRISRIGPFDTFTDIPESQVLDIGGVIVPGFVDVHIHWVQHHVRGRFQSDLMEWLRQHIWPEEVRFSDSAFSRAHAQLFFADMIEAGTTMGMAYSSPHPEALAIAADAAQGDWLLGNSIMERCAPEPLCRTSPDNVDAITPLLESLGVSRYAITPRFALNCSAELMKDLGNLARRTGAYTQTHLAESPVEIREVLDAFPEAEDYTDIYDRAGLLTPRTVLGHCIHLSEREFRCLAERGAWIAHCPSSNEALGSGRMDIDAVRHHGIPFALASDVGAGPSHSMLHVMQRFTSQHRQAGSAVTIQEALYRATLAGAYCLGRGDMAGNFLPGKRADFVVLPPPDRGTSPEDWLEEIITGRHQDLEVRSLETWLGGERIMPAAN